MGLPKAYEPGKYEADIYKLWEEQGVFKADPTSDKPHFSIAMPPPNETGTLHVGQALGLTLQDILGRRARQQGCDVLLLHGTDHAALPVNLLMVKELAEQGTTKEEIGREEFIKRTKTFVGTSRETINSQVKAMGAGVDWSRLRYTLDHTLNQAVNVVFTNMYEDGLIYRGSRIVNWDPELGTTVSDDEMIYKEERTPLYTLQFGPFQIATSRPETKFGDKYVVMHPADERYKQYKNGDELDVEWLNGKIKATVIKDEAIEPEFGTGVMTITPWHDKTDFEIAERHGLEKEPVIDLGGNLLPIAGGFAGMPIGEARPKIVEMLEKKGLVVKTDENYVHNVALNDRGKGVIEPQIMLQWFVDVNRPAIDWNGQKRSFKEVMRAVVDDGEVKLTPRRFDRLYYHWIDNLRDWCISRQVWWGHQIPAWRIKESGDDYVAARNESAAAQKLGVDKSKIERDPDTLDTWFSSALWTWSTLLDQEYVNSNSGKSIEDWLENSPDYQTYHPTSVMETGWDILFFWVARMILATTYATGQVPFKDVYLHGLVRTEAGKKMSKSDPDSNIDPLEIINQYGTDALRMALAGGATAGNDQRLGQGDIVAARNFANKLWNVARFIENQGADNKSTDIKPVSPADHWILNMLSISMKSVDEALAKFRFDTAYDKIYHFVWDDLADWYVEASKHDSNPALSRYVLEQTLKLVHPFAPFVTEAIWQAMGDTADRLLAGQTLDKLMAADTKVAKQFEDLKSVVQEVRKISSALELSKPRLFYSGEGGELIASLSGLGAVEASDEPKGLKLINAEAWLDIDGEAAQKYLEKLKQQADQAASSVKLLESRLKDKSYTDKAPQELVDETKAQLAEAQATHKTLSEELTKYQKSQG